MDKLPDDVLEEVLRRLPPSDRLESALTCQRWARAVSMPSFLKDVLVTIHGPQMRIASNVLIKSHRQYQNLQLSRVDLSDFDPEFWGKIGGNVRELEFYRCNYTSHVFYKILRTCSRLESLKITNSCAPEPTNSVSDLSLPEGICLEVIRSSLSNVRRLHLGPCVTTEMLAHLLRAMPNVSSISLSYFRCAADSASKISDLLGTTRQITSLSFHPASSIEGKISLLRLVASNMRELQLGYRNWMNRSVSEAVSGCTKLLRLTLPANQSFQDVHLKELLLNNPHLRTLQLTIYDPFSDESLAIFRELHKLRELSLVFSESCITNEFLCSLGEISTLQLLDLEGPIDDVRIFRSIANLPKLHTLRVRHLDSECLDVVVEKLVDLSVLDLGNCCDLSDEDFWKLRNLRKLKSLTFTLGVSLTDRALEKGLGPPSLEYLMLGEGSCVSLTDAAVASIAAHHDRLRTFVLFGGRKITRCGIVNLLRSEPLLRELELYVSHLTDGFLEEIEDLCPRLRVLRIPSIRSISAVARLEARRPMIRFIT